MRHCEQHPRAKSIRSFENFSDVAFPLRSPCNYCFARSTASSLLLLFLGNLFVFVDAFERPSSRRYREFRLLISLLYRVTVSPTIDEEEFLRTNLYLMSVECNIFLLLRSTLARETSQRGREPFLQHLFCPSKDFHRVADEDFRARRASAR